jgi:pyruvate dehydrogenase E2 component (dihydrolipoamide acetyltransferase)
VLAAPFVRRLAKDLNVRLEDVPGSGPQGRIRIADVEAASHRTAAGGRPADAADVGALSPTEATDDSARSPVEAADSGAVPPSTARPSQGPPPAAPIAASAGTVRRTDADTTRGVDADAVRGSDAETVRAVGVGPARAAGGEAARAAGTDVVHGAEAESVRGADAETARRPDADVIPLRGLRKAIADHMVEAMRHAPQVTSMDLFDLTELVAAREAMLGAASAEGIKLSYLPFFAKAAVQALRAVPAANAVLDEAAGVIRLKREVNIGIATAVPGGLVVPVVKHADQLSVLEIAAEIERLVQAARERRSPPVDLADGTFTITSFGGLAGSPLFATPILNYPEVAILGIGRIDLQPRVVDGQVVARQCAGVSLTFDHRVLDGEGAGQFMAVLKRYLEHPLELLLHLR